MKKALLILIGLTLIVSVANADNWPQWRGPDYNGVCAGKDFPTKWSRTENIAWKVSMPEGSGSTPIVWNDHIFITSTANGKNLLICFDQQGQKRWQQPLGNARKARHRQKGSGAHPSSATDGKSVFAYFKSGDLACLDFAGKILWQKNLQQLYGPDTLWWDLGTSPVLTKDLVVVAVMHDKPSYLVGFDKQTGEVIWKQDRTMDAPREANHSYTTPLILSRNGKEIIYVLGADHVTAHDAKTGMEIWRVGGLNPRNHQFFRSIASPVITDDILVAPYARGGTLTAIRLGGSGDVTDSHVAWVNQEISCDIPTPVATDGKVYLATDRGKIACLDIRTGKEIWSGKLASRSVSISSSPILVDGKIYVISEKGTTYVLEQGDAFKILAANELDEFTLASPVFTKNHILIRTFENLYCIGM
jgi:outer membrane protein assembly factor BamB